jgi:predicted neutral ceramidase superfamily lipid hydrolase
VENPLGDHPNAQTIIPRAIDAVRAAVADLETVEATTLMVPHELDVLGTGRASEMLSTINAVVSIAKIAAPLILAAALGLALITILFTPQWLAIA